MFNKYVYIEYYKRVLTLTFDIDFFESKSQCLTLELPQTKSTKADLISSSRIKINLTDSDILFEDPNQPERI